MDRTWSILQLKRTTSLMGEGEKGGIGFTGLLKKRGGVWHGGQRTESEHIKKESRRRDPKVLRQDRPTVPLCVIKRRL